MIDVPRQLLIGLLLAGAAVPAHAAPAGLSEGRLPVFGAGEFGYVVERAGDAFVLYGENRTACELTVDTTLTLTNLVADPFPATQVLPALGRVPLATWRLEDPGRRYRYRHHFRFRLGAADARHDAGYAYALPFPAGETHRVSKGWNEPETHVGGHAYAVDVGLPEGTPVLAMREGTVVATHAKAVGGGTGKQWWGTEKVNFVIVRHPDRTLGYYWHLKPGGVAVAVGQAVRRGERLGYSGSTGRSSGPHLHVEVGNPIDGRRERSWPFVWKPARTAPPRPPVKGMRLVAFEGGG